MMKPLKKASGMLGLSRYYFDLKDRDKAHDALNDAATLLKESDNDNDKLRLAIALAQNSLGYDQITIYETFNLAVNVINKLPPAEKDKEQRYYVSLMPIAEDLTKGFRMLAAQDSARALTMVHEIKLPELRVAALSGVYSSQDSPAIQVKNN